MDAQWIRDGVSAPVLVLPLKDGFEVVVKQGEAKTACRAFSFKEPLERCQMVRSGAITVYVASASEKGSRTDYFTYRLYVRVRQARGRYSLVLGNFVSPARMRRRPRSKWISFSSVTLRKIDWSSERIESEDERFRCRCGIPVS